MYSILRYFVVSEKIKIILISFFIAAILGYLFAQSLTNNIRWTIYLFFGPLSIMLFLSIKSEVFRFAAIIFAIIFIDGILFTKVSISDYVSFSLSYILLLSVLFFPSAIKQESAIRKYLIFGFVIFIFAAIGGMLQGIIRDSFYASANVKDFVTYYLGFLLFFLAGYKSFNDKRQALKLLEIIIFFGLLVSIGHLFSMTTGIQLQAIRAEMANEDKDLMGTNWRYGGFLGNPNNLAAFYAMIIPASMIFALYSKKFSTKLISILSIVAMVISLLLLGSRGGLLFLFVNFLISLFFLKLNIKQTALAFFVITAAYFSANEAIEKYFSSQFERTIKRFEKAGVEDIREHIWKNSVEIIKDNPMGLGLATYHFTKELKNRSGMTWSNPHNIYIEFLTQGGFLTLLGFLIIAIGSLIQLGKSFYHSNDIDERIIYGTSFLIFSGFLLAGLTEPVFRNGHKLNYFLAIILGASLSLSFNKINNKRDDNVAII